MYLYIYHTSLTTWSCHVLKSIQQSEINIKLDMFSLWWKKSQYYNKETPERSQKTRHNTVPNNSKRKRPEKSAKTTIWAMKISQNY